MNFLSASVTQRPDDVIAARVDSRSCPRPACALTAARIARGEGRHPGHSAFTPRAGPPFPCPALQWEVRTTHAAVWCGTRALECRGRGHSRQCPQCARSSALPSSLSGGGPDSEYIKTGVVSGPGPGPGRPTQCYPGPWRAGPLSVALSGPTGMAAVPLAVGGEGGGCAQRRPPFSRSVTRHSSSAGR